MNRASGLYGKLSDTQKAGLKKPEGAGNVKEIPQKEAKYRIAPALHNLTVDINSLTPDPDNARQHPERNIESIKDSLRFFGQVKPLVVNSNTGIVVAGNGTLEAAKELGWDTIAVAFIEMTDAEAAAYGLADNRTAELAKWDMEVVARLDRLIQDSGYGMPGWTTDELEVMRASEFNWVPPAIDDNATFTGEQHSKNDPLVVAFDADQYEIVGPAIHIMRKIQEQMDMSQPEALRLICQEWMEAQSTEGEE